MMAEDVVYAVVDSLESLGVPYMLVGSFSSNLYGLPRSTKDADFVVELGDLPVSRIQERLGAGFRLDPQMSLETVTNTYHFIVTHAATAFKVEFFLLGNDPHDRERFARRVRGSFPGRAAYVSSPEDVVVTKLRWSKGGNRAKDMDDVVNVIHAQRATLDWDYVRRWCGVHGTLDLLERARVEAEED